MRMTKAQRAELREKFGGKCAYCGRDLPERWHADHLIPCRREITDKKVSDGVYRLVSVGSGDPATNVIENMMPACPPCNISKGSMSLEGWRRWLAGHINSLNEYHPIYRISKAFGLVEETGKPVIFHFEKQEQPHE